MANARLIGGLCQRYGWDVLIRVQEVFWTLPENPPEEAAYQALESSLGLQKADITCLIEELWRTVPELVQRRTPHNRVYFLCPPTQVCLLGCRYKRGKNKGDPCQLVGHKSAVEVEVFELDRVVKQGFDYTLPCLVCESRYSYFTYYDSSKKMHFLYEE
ncbi:hypothetical protein RvY_02884 [Ramazzottius varieornatus]|uniref:Uncharacterized protein n=1 Tax=Ramazzottius varieornatus TaxID=947166 RepID=A0A1D1UL78_RAMVA|nr:hypothetical protein RvY_02884 [Ramazzottius varieornatus]